MADKASLAEGIDFLRGALLLLYKFIVVLIQRFDQQVLGCALLGRLVVRLAPLILRRRRIRGLRHGALRLEIHRVEPPLPAAVLQVLVQYGGDLLANFSAGCALVEGDELERLLPLEMVQCFEIVGHQALLVRRRWII